MKLIKHNSIIIILILIFIVPSVCIAQQVGWIKGVSINEVQPHQDTQDTTSLSRRDSNDNDNDNSHAGSDTYRSSIKNEESVKIKKYLLPSSTAGYAIGNNFTVLVEVINLKDAIENIDIVERIDNDFNISNEYNSYYIEYNLTKASILINKLKNSVNEDKLVQGQDYYNSNKFLL